MISALHLSSPPSPTSGHLTGGAPLQKPVDFAQMAGMLAVLAEPALDVVLAGAVAALAEHGFAREAGLVQVVPHTDEDRLHVVSSCTVSDAAGEQRLSVVATYILQQSPLWRKPEVTGKVYLVVGVVGQVPLDRYDRANALGAALVTETRQRGLVLQPEHFADSVALLAKDCGQGAGLITRNAKIVARVLARKLEP